MTVIVTGTMAGTEGCSSSMSIDDTVVVVAHPVVVLLAMTGTVIAWLLLLGDETRPTEAEVEA